MHDPACFPLDRARSADETRGERQAEHAPRAASPGDALLGRPRCQEWMRLVAVAAELSMQCSNLQAITSHSKLSCLHRAACSYLIGSMESEG